MFRVARNSLVMHQKADDVFIFRDIDNCAIRDVISQISDKWSIMVLLSLAKGTLRFGQLRERIENISQRMLTSTLRKLERDGYVRREAFAVIPPRVDYSLTEQGRSLLDPLVNLCRWAESNQSDIRNARASYEQGSARKS